MAEQPSKDLLKAADKQPAVFERRKSRGKRLRPDRRNGVRRHIGIDVSPSGVGMAVIEETDDSSSLIVEYVEFPEDSGPRRGDWSGSELSDLLCNLVSQHSLGGEAVVVSIGGHPCVTRVVAGDNAEVDNEIAELTGRSQRYLGMGLGDKVSCETTHQIDAKRKRVCVTIAMRNMVDAVADAVDDANLRLAYLEHTMLVLCRILRKYDVDTEEPVLFIVDELGRIDLGISYQGRLLLDYRPAMPEDSYTGRSIVQRHIRSLRRYVQAQLPGVTFNLSRIFVTGGKIASETLYAGRGKRSELRRCHFPLFEMCHGFDAVFGDINEEPGIIAAVGIANMSREGESVTETNDLISVLNTKKDIPWMRLLADAWPMIVAASIALVLFLMGNHVTRQADRAEQEIETLANANADGNTIRLKLRRHLERTKQVNSLAEAIGQPKWGEVFLNAGVSLPSGTWLESIRVEHNGEVQLSGASHGGDAVYEYIGRLRDSGAFTRVALESTSSSRSNLGPEYRFDVSAYYDLHRSSQREKSQMVSLASGSPDRG